MSDDPGYVEFMVARAKAIQEYASIEQGLFILVAQLMEADPAYVGILFFKVTSARARNRAFEDLAKKRLGSDYNLFINSLVKRLNSLDQKRNEIVHWHVVENLGPPVDGVMKKDWLLYPPNFWDMKPTTPSISVSAMNDFAKECSFVSRFISLFGLTLFSPEHVKKSMEEMWLPFFKVSIEYPPKAGHPLAKDFAVVV